MQGFVNPHIWMRPLEIQKETLLGEVLSGGRLIPCRDEFSSLGYPSTRLGYLSTHSGSQGLLHFVICLYNMSIVSDTVVFRKHAP